jgi:hypothetical protein
MNTSLKIIGMLLNSDDIDFIHNRVVVYKNGVKIYLDTEEMNQLIFLFSCFDKGKDLNITAQWEAANHEG